MSPICGIVRESFDDYLGDALPAPQRNMLREHLAECAACLAAASAKDASFLFARPRPMAEDVASDETARILANVRAGVGHIQTERRIAVAARRRYAGVAAAAAVALLVLTIPGGSDARREPEIAALPAPVPSPGAAEQAFSSGIAPAGLPAEAASPSTGATVYDLNPGAANGEPRVVWIVDRGLDI